MSYRDPWGDSCPDRWEAERIGRDEASRDYFGYYRSPDHDRFSCDDAQRAYEDEYRREMRRQEEQREEREAEERHVQRMAEERAMEQAAEEADYWRAMEEQRYAEDMREMERQRWEDEQAQERTP